RVCSGQQESGSACVSSRGNYGVVSLRDWLPVGVDEYGYVAPDPLNPDIVYGGRNVTRFDRRTGQVSSVGPIAGRGGGGGAPGTFRQVRTMPVVFSEVDKRSLFFANNHLWKTVNGGESWSQISPDLTRQTWTTPKSVGKYTSMQGAQSSQRGVIYTVAPSYQEINRVWVGTDDGLIHVTADGGKTWKDVTPPALTPWAKVSLIDAGRFSAQTAYAAINTLRLDDLRPHIYRTKDGGQTWTEIVNGLPPGGIVNAVREDPQRRGLLFAGTEQAVYVSFDDGDSWQSLRLNMPATSIRDLVVKDTDLVVGTHGRGFWILDDISPLRQITADIARVDAFLFRPSTAWRFRWNQNTDTPLPPDEPAAPNPPDGVTISYLLGPGVRGSVTLEIIDTVTGDTLRRYTSDDPEDPPVAGRNIPDYWIRPAQRLSAAPGLHRFVWDGRYAPPPVDRVSYPIAAVAGNTPKTPRGMWVAPGTYQVRLTAGGKSLRQPIVVRMDPRVRTSTADLALQFKLSKSLDDMMRQLARARTEIAKQLEGSSGAPATRLQAQIAALQQATAPMVSLFESIQRADARPTAAQEAAAVDLIKKAEAAIAASKEG
ncbi:MAG TPA: hypothetical protein VF424_00410, partial [Vicinamibacterales bacterium]